MTKVSFHPLRLICWDKAYLVSEGIIKPDPERLEALKALHYPKNMAELKRVLVFFSYYSQWIKKFSDVIRPLVDTSIFPLDTPARESFDKARNSIIEASMAAIVVDIPFTVETDASSHAIAATLNQNG